MSHIILSWHQLLFQIFYEIIRILIPTIKQLGYTYHQIQSLELTEEMNPQLRLCFAHDPLVR